MKFIVDANLPASLCRWLQARGHQALYSGHLMSAETADHDIARHAIATGSIVITKDRDLVDLQARFDHKVLWLRCGNLTRPSLFAWLALRWPGIEKSLTAGATLVEVRLIG